MFGKRVILSFAALVFFLALESAIIIGIAKAPSYPGYRMTPKTEAVPLEKGEFSCTFQKVEFAEKGTVCANFYFECKGQTKDRVIYYGILNEGEKDFCLNESSSPRKVKELVGSKGIYDLSYFARHRFLMLRQNVDAPGVYYFATVVQKEAGLVPGDLYYFVTNTRAKMRSFWPYLLIAVRDVLLALLVFAAGFLFSRRFSLPKRLFCLFLACGAAAAFIAFTPENVLLSAKRGPHGRLLSARNEAAELSGGAVIANKVEELAPYATVLAKVKGHTFENRKGLVFCDLYKAPSYDTDKAEHLMSFWGDGKRERYFALDTMHSFLKSVSIRLFLFNFGEDAVIDGYEFWEVKLPPIIMKVVLALRNALTPAFPAVWLGLFAAVVVFLLYLKRGLVSKLTVVCVTALTLVTLFLPIYCFGREEAIVERTPTRFYMAGEPLNLYAVRWRNAPKEDAALEETPGGELSNFNIQAFDDKLIGGANSLYPDNHLSFCRFFTRFYSGIKINVLAERVRISDVRYVKLSPSLLIFKTMSWLWIMALVAGGLFQIFRTIAGRSDG